MKILVILVMIYGLLSAGEKSCLMYLDEMNKAQDELAIYIVEDMNSEAYEAVKHCKRMAIKAKVNCSDVPRAKKVDFMAKIKEFSAIQEKYKLKLK